MLIIFMSCLCIVGFLLLCLFSEEDYRRFLDSIKKFFKGRK